MQASWRRSDGDLRTAGLHLKKEFAPLLRILLAGFFTVCASSSAAWGLWMPTAPVAAETRPEGLRPGVPRRTVRGGVLDSVVKAQPMEPVLESAAPRIEVAAARNEYETAQVILTGTHGSVDGLSAKVTALAGEKGEISASDIEIYLAHHVQIDVPSDSLGRSGKWPDALVPLRRPFSIGAGQGQSLWLKIFVRPEAAAGTYRGSLTVSASGSPVLTVDIVLVVWDITLPQDSHFPVMFGVDYDSIRKFEGQKLSDQMFEQGPLPAYYAALLRNRAYPLLLYNTLPEYREVNGNVRVRFEEFERRLRAAYQGRPLGPMAIPFSTSWPVDPSRYPLFSDGYNRRAIAYLRQVAAFYEKLGVLDRSFIYLADADEPNTREQYAGIREFAKLARAANPRLRMLQTIFSECHGCREEGIDTLEPYVGLWVPNIAFFDGVALRATLDPSGTIRYSSASSRWTPAFTQRVKQRDTKIWWYFNPWTQTLSAPHLSYPTLFIDHQGIEHRLIPWMAYKYGVTGLGHWNATYWQKVSNPWSKVPRGESGSDGNGDGSLLYPGRGSNKFTGQPDPPGPITSIRLELLREGVEDYELLHLLDQSGKRDIASRIVNGLVNSLQQFDRKPERLREARRQLADEIIRLRKPGTPLIRRR